MGYCNNCGKEITGYGAYCSFCGAPINSASPGSSNPQQPTYIPPRTNASYSQYVPQKSPGVAVIIALIAGFFGLWGVGHMYAGKVGEGIVLLVAGIVIAALFWVSLILTVIVIGIFGLVVFGIMLFGGWLWQTYDAFQTAKEYNELALRNGRAPW
jgi:TM2 domain-containing membrane protein YozV